MESGVREDQISSSCLLHDLAFKRAFWSKKRRAAEALDRNILDVLQNAREAA